MTKRRDSLKTNKIIEHAVRNTIYSKAVKAAKFSLQRAITIISITSKRHHQNAAFSIISLSIQRKKSIESQKSLLFLRIFASNLRVFCYENHNTQTFLHLKLYVIPTDSCKLLSRFSLSIERTYAERYSLAKSIVDSNI